MNVGRSLSDSSTDANLLLTPEDSSDRPPKDDDKENLLKEASGLVELSQALRFTSDDKPDAKTENMLDKSGPRKESKYKTKEHCPINPELNMNSQIWSVKSIADPVEGHELEASTEVDNPISMGKFERKKSPLKISQADANYPERSFLNKSEDLHNYMLSNSPEDISMISNQVPKEDEVPSCSKIVKKTSRDIIVGEIVENLLQVSSSKHDPDKNSSENEEFDFDSQVTEVEEEYFRKESKNEVTNITQVEPTVHASGRTIFRQHPRRSGLFKKTFAHLLPKTILLTKTNFTK